VEEVSFRAKSAGAKLEFSPLTNNITAPTNAIAHTIIIKI
jgi:hypothetical protein